MARTLASGYSDVAYAPSPKKGAWSDLSDAIRRYDADVVVLVARKMPRLADALCLNLGDHATCISDQAIPFVHRELINARVAIVDDVWNVGTTLMRALERVKSANPRSVRMFALGARDAAAARNKGVTLAIGDSLTDKDYQSFVESVPATLRLVSKPYDADFPIVPCLIRTPFKTWGHCWQWLRSRFGDRVHSTLEDSQLACGFARASINVAHDSGWTIKSRLYFDIRRRTCNFVPMALAPSLSLTNDYPIGSFSAAIFGVLEKAIGDKTRPPADVIAEGNWHGVARANTFCDSLLFADTMLVH